MDRMRGHVERVGDDVITGHPHRALGSGRAPRVAEAMQARDASRGDDNGAARG
jgi:hypothetical protein